MSTKWNILSGLFITLNLLSFAAAQQTHPGRDCIVCEGPTGATAHIEQYQGRWVAVCPGPCQEHWAAHPDKYFLKLRSHGALFDENSISEKKANNGWLYLGMYVLIGLIFGAMCAYIAVTNGHGAIAWFWSGMLFNVLALIAIFIKRQGDMSQWPEGVPDGFGKVLLTYSPVNCQTCGGQNHPSAPVCNHCGTGLEPATKSESTKLNDNPAH